MSLSCSCDDYCEKWHFPPEDYTTLATKRWRKCCSCMATIRPGDMCAKFEREKNAEPGSVEERIHGEIVELAALYMCEACADQYFNLADLGYCISLGDDMRELLREYVEMTRQHGAVESQPASS
jgi:hypothetical protein